MSQAAHGRNRTSRQSHRKNIGRPGAGLSDRKRHDVQMGSEASTLSELVDHLGLARFHVFAVSCAGPPTLAYAATHPERIDRLVFFGSFLRGEDVGPTGVKEAMQSLVRAHWGIGSRMITNLFAPDLAGPEVERLSRNNRRAASPEMAARLLALSFESNAAEVAAEVKAKALVIHREGDKTVRFDAGRELAAALPNADLLRLEGNAHVPWLGDVDPVVDAVLGFLGSEQAVIGAESYLDRRHAFVDLPRLAKRQAPLRRGVAGLQHGPPRAIARRLAVAAVSKALVGSGDLSAERRAGLCAGTRWIWRCPGAC
jgi:pimeloyl-ACP methyl ester carboxylesterase